MARVVVQRYDNGPIRAVLEAEHDRLEMFRKSERNALLSNALVRGMTAWRNVFVRIRFQRSVLDPPFNYQGDRRSPMVDTGDMSRSVYNGRIVARAPGGNVHGYVTLPFSHAVTREISRVWKVLPPDEVAYVAKIFAKAVAHEAQSADEIVPRRPTVHAAPRRRLTVAQRARFGLKERKAYTRRAKGAS